ncbi:MAG: hypothetical protein LBP19_03230 [Treponema sp.]|nr:hypothetical protein [Treponema sp.]
MHEVGVKVHVETGDAVSSLGRLQGALATTGEAMKKAEQENRWIDHAGLSLEYDRLKARTSVFQKDVSTLYNDPRNLTQTATGGPVFKMDSEYGNLIKTQIDAIKKLTAEYEEAARIEDIQKMRELAPQIGREQADFHKAVEQSAQIPRGEKAAQALAQSFSADRLVSAITGGVSMAVGYANKAGIVSKMGSGDPIGAEIEKTRKDGELIGGILKTGLTAIGALAANMIAPGIGSIAVGGLVGGGTADIIKSLGFYLGANIRETEEAGARQWERQAPAAMELTALLGKYGGSKEENTQSIRRTFENAANTATEYGFSPEEGVEQVKQAAAQGLNETRALDSARDVFAFERGTGADRGVLSEFRNRTERFGIADGLNAAWQGSQAVFGMNPAQFNEYLRATQNTFEDGISKGFVRGAGEIAGTFSFLSDLGGGSELWKGEQGANRLSQMNAGLAATTGLSSVSDILSFRGAQNVLKQWDAKGDAEAGWETIGDLDPKKEGLEIRRGYDYIDSMIMLERGLRPELFHAQMQMLENTEGPGNREGAVEQMKNIYGLNYTGSAALYQMYQDKRDDLARNGGDINEYFSNGKWAEELERFKANPDYIASTELDMFKDVADIRKYTQQIGQ